MKFVALTALIATASAASDWAICSAASDCTTAGSKCCSASNTGKATVKICAPSATVVVPNVLSLIKDIPSAALPKNQHLVKPLVPTD